MPRDWNRSSVNWTPAERFVETRQNVFNVEDAIGHLRKARDLLKAAGARRTTPRVRLALSSAYGALRHAQRMKNTADREA